MLKTVAVVVSMSVSRPQCLWWVYWPTTDKQEAVFLTCQPNRAPHAGPRSLAGYNFHSALTAWNSTFCDVTVAHAHIAMLMLKRYIVQPKYRLKKSSLSTSPILVQIQTLVSLHTPTTQGPTKIEQSILFFFQVRKKTIIKYYISAMKVENSTHFSEGTQYIKYSS